MEVFGVKSSNVTYTSNWLPVKFYLCVVFFHENTKWSFWRDYLNFLGRARYIINVPKCALNMISTEFSNIPCEPSEICAYTFSWFNKSAILHERNKLGSSLVVSTVVSQFNCLLIECRPLTLFIRLYVLWNVCSVPVKDKRDRDETKK